MPSSNVVALFPKQNPNPERALEPVSVSSRQVGLFTWEIVVNGEDSPFGRYYAWEKEHGAMLMRLVEDFMTAGRMDSHKKRVRVVDILQGPLAGRSTYKIVLGFDAEYKVDSSFFVHRRALSCLRAAKKAYDCGFLKFDIESVFR